MCPVEPLVAEFEKRNKLRVLAQWLEDRVKEGNVEPSLHNAVGKIYVTTNNGAKDWLLNNRFYDCLLYTSPSPRDRQKSRMPSSA